MSSSPSSRLTATHIPNITQLRTELDYGDASLSRCKTFYDDIRVYRRKFRTTTGKKGDEIHDWKGAEAQAALNEITEAYLDGDGNGPLFWPKDEEHPNSNALQYTKHHTVIRRLVKQLIFRLNQQQFRNNKYKKKDQAGEQTITSRGASMDNPIDIDDTSIDEKPHIARNAQQRSRQTTHAGQSPTLSRSHIVKLSVPGDKIASLGTRASNAIGSHRDEASAPSRRTGGTERSSTAPRRTGREDSDIYNVPSSPEPSGQARKRPSTAQQSGRSPPGATKRQKKPPPIIDDGAAEKGPAAQPSPQSRKIGQQSHRVPNAEGERSAASPDRPRRSDTEVEKERDAWMLRYSDDIVAQMLNEDIAQLDSIRRQRNEIEAEPGSALSQVPRTSSPPLQPLQPPPTPDIANRIVPSTEPLQPPLHSSPPTNRASTVENVLPTVETPTDNMPERKDANKQSTPAGGTERPKPAIEISYLLILSRSPIYESKLWDPQGSFQELTLAQLLDQLPFGSDVEGLNFTFEGPGLRIKERVDRENETGFAKLKMQLNKGLRAVLANHPPSTKLLVYELEIEPPRDGAVVEDEEDDLTSFF